MTSEESREIPDTTNSNRVESIRELLPAYVLGALDEDEQALVEAELARSEELRREFEHLQSTADTLIFAVPESEPPDSLRERLLSSTTPSVKPEPIPARRPDRLFPVAAVAAALVLALGAAVALMWNELNERDDRINELEAAASNRGGTDFSQPLVWTEIGAAGPESDVWGYFCRTEDGNVGWIVVEGMLAQGDQVFQVWLVDGDRLVSGGIFSTDSEGRGFGVVRADEPVQSFHQIQITVEPPGGSPAPTSDPDVAVPII